MSETTANKLVAEPMTDAKHTPCIYCGGEAAAYLNAYPQFNMCMLDWLCMRVDAVTMLQYAAYLDSNPIEPLGFAAWRAPTPQPDAGEREASSDGG